MEYIRNFLEVISMRTCPECKAQFEDGKSFCPNCGKYLPLYASPAQAEPSGDPVAKLLNIDVPDLTERSPEAEKGEFARIFKESLSESAPETAVPVSEKSAGSPAKKEVSWETSYKSSRGNEPEKDSPDPDTAEDENPPSVDLENIVRAEAAAIEKNEVPSVGSFVLTAFLLSLPIVGLIYLIALAVGGTKYPAKANFARGVLMFMLIVCFLCSAAFLIAVLGFDFDPAPYADAFWEAVLAVGEIFSTKF